jgi:hypothetical protein
MLCSGPLKTAAASTIKHHPGKTTLDRLTPSGDVTVKEQSNWAMSDITLGRSNVIIRLRKQKGCRDAARLFL